MSSDVGYAMLCEFQECYEHGCNQCESKWGTIYLCDAHKKQMQDDGDLEPT